MANRKVLINRHTSGNTVPVATDMYKGEIAVQHKTGEEILWTKNNDEKMVPFISCAQTISIVSGMISSVDVIYDVNKKEGEPYINVGSGQTGNKKTFTLSTSGVASETNLNALSSATVNNFQRMTNILSALTDAVITGVTGDDAISVESGETGAGASNTVKLTHKSGEETSGFKKLTTDAFGHVTAATPVTTADIVALGFKTSADTDAEIDALSASVVTNKANIEALSAGTKQLSADTHNKIESVYGSATTYADDAIAAAIDGLDSSKTTADNKHYITAITIADGKLSTIGEAEIPVLASTVTGTGNVVTDIAVNDHTITFAKDLTVASDTDLKAVSGIVDTFSAATMAEFTSAFTAIQAMDKDADAVDGKVVTTVSEVDGVVSETKANVKDLQLGGYVKDTTATGDIAGTDTINAALSKLENKANAITIANADGSINVTTGATGTDINVNIKSGEKVLAKDGAAGLYTDIDLVKITTGLPATVKERYQLLATDDSQIGVNIDVPKDSHIVSINYITTGEHAQNLEYVYIDASGVTQTTYVDMSELVLEAEFASGVTVTDHIAHGVVDPTTENFLTVGADGFKVSGVQDAIDAKVNALDVTGDTAVAGQYVAAIEQTNGVVAVKTRANVSEAVLTNYAKGTDGSAVAATDSIREAIGKLENQIDNAKAAATTKVVEGTDAGNNMTITSAADADNSVTYTVNLVDIASSTALTAEIAARKAVDGQNGDTYAANAGTNFISDATSLNDADVKLDAALKAVSDKVNAAKVTEGTSVENYVALALDTATTAGTTALTINDSALKTKIDTIDSAITAETKAREDAIKALDSVGSASTTGHYLTSVTITDGKISAVGEEALPAATPVTTVNGTTGTTVAPVLTGIVTGGTEGHELTLNYTNKVLSAQTADEAAHASAATKVDSALALTDVAGTNRVKFDGSANKTVTFGKAVGSIGNSMSMDANGVVDVEIIDCGEY